MRLQKPRDFLHTDVYEIHLWRIQEEQPIIIFGKKGEGIW
jgi:hypothetical protein